MKSYRSNDNLMKYDKLISFFFPLTWKLNLGYARDTNYLQWNSMLLGQNDPSMDQ